MNTEQASPTIDVESKDAANLKAELRNGESYANRQAEDAIKLVMTESIKCIEKSYPHVKSDGSVNEKMFNMDRNHILNVGNNSIRRMGKVFEGCQTIVTTEVNFEQNYVNSGYQVRAK